MKKKKWLIVSITVSLMLLALHPFYEIRYSDPQMECFPYRIWFVDKTSKNPAIGDFVMFKTKAPYIPDTKRWIKKVFAAEGGKVEVVPATNNEMGTIIKSGMERKLPIRAYVTVAQAQNKETFVAFAADSIGRELAVIQAQTIPQDHYFMYSPVPRSYDSRYWGLVKKNEIIGKAYPIL